MSNKRMDSKGEFRNESARVAEAELKGEELLPKVPTTIADVVMFGNNALHYCFANFVEMDGAGEPYGEWSDGTERLAAFLVEHGCDPNEPNDFGVRFCDLHTCPWRESLFRTWAK